MVVEHQLDCPCCGETLTVLVDLSAETQDYVEDCSVCCQPMDVHVDSDGDTILAISAAPSH